MKLAGQIHREQLNLRAWFILNSESKNFFLTKGCWNDNPRWYASWSLRVSNNGECTHIGKKGICSNIPCWTLRTSKCFVSCLTAGRACATIGICRDRIELHQRLRFHSSFQWVKPQYVLTWERCFSRANCRTKMKVRYNLVIVEDDECKSIKGYTMVSRSSGAVTSPFYTHYALQEPASRRGGSMERCLRDIFVGRFYIGNFLRSADE